ncbi:MAG: transposase [Thiocapsa sp.]|nr:MAG: transposase [Thiocapsa sp.]
MEGTTRLDPSAERPHPCLGTAGGKGSRFAREWVTISKQEHIDLRARANYWEAQHARAKAQVEALTQEVARKEATIKDLRQRLFGKKSEKHGPLPSEKERGDGDDAPQRKRGQQPGRAGHGRTPRPTLPVVAEQHAPADGQSACPHCGLPYRRTPALDEQSTVIEVQVRAYTRRITRCAYTRDPGCCCENTPAVISAPPPARLIARSPFGVSFWVEMLLGKYRYGQPSNRLLQDLADQGLPVSPGTLAGGLQRLTGLFEPVLEALYCKQMSETLFNNDETRWEVFVDLEGKVGTRWYLWLTRSASVVFYCIDPSRSAAVPGAHFAGLQGERAIIVCDRYSAYKSSRAWPRTSCWRSAGRTCAATSWRRGARCPRWNLGRWTSKRVSACSTISTNSVWRTGIPIAPWRSKARRSSTRRRPCRRRWRTCTPRPNGCWRRTTPTRPCRRSPAPGASGCSPVCFTIGRG